MVKVFRYNNYIAILNVKNGKIAYFKGDTRQIRTREIPNFDSYDIREFTSKDYSLFYLGFNISKKCNLNCSYCFIDKSCNEKIDKFFISNQIIKFLKNTPQCKKLFIDLSGDGEPLLEKQLISEIAKECLLLSKEYNIEIIPTLICNGTLLTKETVRFLQTNLILFGVSFDGTKENHDKYRIFKNGTPTYDLISKNLLNIEKNDYVGVSMVLTPEFEDNIVNCYLDMLKHAPTIAIRFKRNTKSTDNSFYRCSYRVVNGYKELVLLLIKQLKNSDYKLFYAILNGDDMFGKIFIRVFMGFRVDSPCEGSIARHTITKNGLYPCSPASDEKIFKIDYFTDNNKEFQSTIIQSKKECLNCYARFYCGGECPIVYKQRGMVDDGLCYIRKNLVKNAIEIVSYLIDDVESNKNIRNFIIEKIKRINVIT